MEVARSAVDGPEVRIDKVRRLKMGSLIEFRRKPPTLRKPPKPDASGSTEETTSLRILLWTFGCAAVAMCATVVVTLSRSWTEMLWISAFVLVFALLKIGLANLLFLVMVRYDRERRPPPAPTPRPFHYARKPPRGSRRATLRVAAAAKPLVQARAPGTTP